jgi:hypothetical protein
MNLNRDIQAYCILDFEPRSASESILGAQKAMEHVARLYQFLIALIIPLGNLEPRPDVCKVRCIDNDFQSPFLCRLFCPGADSFA